MGAVLQLERFDRDALVSPVFRQAELDAAFAEGCAARKRSAPTGCARCWPGFPPASKPARRCGRSRSPSRSGRSPAAGCAVRPVAAGGGADQAARCGAGAACRACRHGLPAGVRIRCGADTGAFLSANLARLGLSAVQVDDTGTEGSVEAEMTGGEILWDEAALATQLRRLIEEMMETD